MTTATLCSPSPRGQVTEYEADLVPCAGAHAAVRSGGVSLTSRAVIVSTARSGGSIAVSAGRIATATTNYLPND